MLPPTSMRLSCILGLRLLVPLFLCSSFSSSSARRGEVPGLPFEGGDVVHFIWLMQVLTYPCCISVLPFTKLGRMPLMCLLMCLALPDELQCAIHCVLHAALCIGRDCKSNLCSIVIERVLRSGHYVLFPARFGIQIISYRCVICPEL